MLRRSRSVRKADAYLCGPAGFLAAARSALLRAGAGPQRIHAEAFASPTTDAAQPFRSKPNASPRAAGRSASATCPAAWKRHGRRKPARSSTWPRRQG